MRKTFLNLWALAALVFAVTACDSDDNDKFCTYPPQLVDSVKMFITCEGNYTKGNASVTAIMKDGSVKQNLFRSVNGRPLGDVAQSISLIDSHFYIVLNNSKKIEVVDGATFRSTATILLYNPQAQPRYICGVGNNKAVLSDAGCDTLRVIDTESFKIIDRIAVGSPTNQMTFASGKLFVKAGEQTLVYNPTTKNTSVLDIAAFADTKMLLDGDKKLWLLCSDAIKTELVKIDPATEQVLERKELEGIMLDQWVTELEYYNGAIYFSSIDENYRARIYCYTIATGELALAFEPQSVAFMYGMGFSNGNPIICDALDFVQSGYIHEMTTSGTEVKSYKVGVCPSVVLSLE
jgi:hypothetical protein